MSAEPSEIQPVLPMMPATPERRSNDYVRHGTTTHPELA